MLPNEHKGFKNSKVSIVWLIVRLKQQSQRKLRRDLVDISSNAISTAKLDTTTDFQRAEMSDSNIDLQLVVNFILIP
jgi:hypothetical protein